MGLTNGDMLRFNQACKIPFLEACVYYGYMKQFKGMNNEVS